MKPPLLSFLFLLALTVPAASDPACHDHGLIPGASGAATGPVTLSDQAVANLGVETFAAEITELAPTLNLPATLTVPPNREAAVSAKFSGKVQELKVKLGDHVKKGQPLASLDPDMIGNPPVTLRAPLDGVVSIHGGHVGDAFGPEDVLMHILDPSVLWAKAVAYESPELAAIRAGGEAHVLADMFPQYEFTGRIVQVSPSLTPGARTFEAFVEIANPEGRLLANSQATVAIPLGEPATVVAVPKRAVVGEDGRLAVFVREDGNVFERRPVVTGIRSGNLVEIVEGVFPGDEVVTQGNYQLQFVGSEPADDHHGHDHGHSHDHGEEEEADGTGLPLYLLLGIGALAALLVLAAILFKPSR